MATPNFPVNLEIWNIFHSALLGNAKKLVEDIAKQNNKDSKELWSRVKGEIKVGLMDIEIDEEIPKLCSHPTTLDSAIHLRCRAPCMLGFSSCPLHHNKQIATDPPSHEVKTVDRVYDYLNKLYFVDSDSIARDKLGKVKGYVKEDVLYLFEADTE
jgi:hypothetical protein